MEIVLIEGGQAGGGELLRLRRGGARHGPDTPLLRVEEGLLSLIKNILSFVNSANFIIS